MQKERQTETKTEGGPRERQRQTGRQIDRQTDRQTERDRQTDKQTEPDSQVGVDDSPVLGVLHGQDTVEAGPEQPQEDGPCHGEGLYSWLGVRFQRQ